MKMLEPEMPWWVGEIVTCPRCGARGELEKWDDVEMSPDAQETTVACPNGCTYTAPDPRSAMDGGPAFKVETTKIIIKKPTVPRRIKEGPSVVLTEAEEAALKQKMPAFPRGAAELGYLEPMEDDDGTETE
jgi:hypothetical protein